MSRQQLQQLVQMLKAQPIAGHPSVEATRANAEQMGALFPVAADVTCEPVDAGGVKAEWMTAPGADAGRAVLYLHGGGYVIGSLNTHRDMASRIATSVATVSPPPAESPPIAMREAFNPKSSMKR